MGCLEQIIFLYLGGFSSILTHQTLQIYQMSETIRRQRQNQAKNVNNKPVTYL